MSKIEVNQISSQCGSTLTIGQSGDTVTLACGATQSGFGRSGSVNWDTTAKTAGFTAVSGNGYFVNTTSGAITATLPATPSAGDIVSFSDYARTFATNNLTIGRNGSLIQGVASDGTVAVDGRSITFVYVDGTKGWVPTEDQTTGQYGALYTVATGGTITTCGDYKIHTFTSPGTFCISQAGNPAGGGDTVDYLVVAGGGGAGGSSPAWVMTGAGGAGGFRASSTTYTIGCAPAAPLTACVSALTVTATGYPITVGGGGAGGPGPIAGVGTQGSNSVFSTITSTGGGHGGVYNPAPGGNGGSGGGGGSGLPAGGSGGTGNTPPVNPAQGSNGGNGFLSVPDDSTRAGGGGGGAKAVGANAGAESGGLGGVGAGLPSAFGTSGENCGSYYYFSGGGTGAGNGSPSPKAGALGGGGNGMGNAGAVTQPDGVDNTGGGGGGVLSVPASTPAKTGGSGGSGIVIIRYKYQ